MQGRTMSNTMEESAGIVRMDYPEKSGALSWVSVRCHPGAVRTENQDRAGYSSVPLGDLFLVLDGVGGQRGGAQAATLALEGYQRAMSNTSRHDDPVEALKQATHAVNADLADAKVSGGAEMQGMASTVALALVHEQIAYIGHIGDSRVYLFREGGLRSLTRDHSVTMGMVDHGILSEAEAKDHASSHILTRSLGQPDASLEITIEELAPGDVLLVCSDGLWAYVPETAMTSVLTEEQADTSSTADRLLELALRAGAPDNVTAVLVRVTEQRSVDERYDPPRSKSNWRLFTGALILTAILLVVGALLALLH